MEKVIVAGPRDFDNLRVVAKALETEYEFELVCGMADGVDNTAKDVILASGWTFTDFPAHWSNLSEKPCVVRKNKSGKYNVLAGLNRNKRMGDYADRLIALWDCRSKGTKDMIKYMLSLGKPVRVVCYEGKGGVAITEEYLRKALRVKNLEAELVSDDIVLDFNLTSFNLTIKETLESED